MRSGASTFAEGSGQVKRSTAASCAAAPRSLGSFHNCTKRPIARPRRLKRFTHDHASSSVPIGEVVVNFRPSPELEGEFIEVFPWDAVFSEKSEPEPAARERRDPLKLARHYQALLDSGKFESRAALGVSRARVKQVLRRLG